MKVYLLLFLSVYASILAMEPKRPQSELARALLAARKSVADGLDQLWIVQKQDEAVQTEYVIHQDLEEKLAFFDKITTFVHKYAPVSLFNGFSSKNEWEAIFLYAMIRVMEKMDDLSEVEKDRIQREYAPLVVLIHRGKLDNGNSKSLFSGKSVE